MNYQFKKFENKNVRQEDKITITKSSSIGFPQRFYQDNNIKGFNYVVLFWDTDSSAIGINFSNNENEKNKFKILHSKLGYGGSIVARSFFRSNDIDVKIYYGRYVWEKVKLESGEELYVIKLQEHKK
jgi:hypothetical protein